MKDQQRKLSGAVKRMLHRQLSKAWEQWQYWYAEVKNQQFRLGGAIRFFIPSDAFK